MILTLVYDKARDSFSARKDGHLFVLSKQADKYKINREFVLPLCADYMIVSRLGKHPKGWIVEPITEEYTLVEHSGFECSGSMCRTMAIVRNVTWPPTTNQNLRGTGITPGRLHGIVKVTDNTNIGFSYGIYSRQEADKLKSSPHFIAKNLIEGIDDGAYIAHYKVTRLPPTPGRCYIKNGDTRAAGVPLLEEIEL